MSVQVCEDAYLKLSEAIFTTQRQKHNIFGRTEDFLLANGRFDSNALAHAIRECTKIKFPEDVLLKDPDSSCKVYVLRYASFITREDFS